MKRYFGAKQRFDRQRGNDVRDVRAILSGTLMASDGSVDSLVHIAETKLREGVTTWLPTTLTQPVEKLRSIATCCAEVMQLVMIGSTSGSRMIDAWRPFRPAATWSTQARYAAWFASPPELLPSTPDVDVEEFGHEGTSPEMKLAFTIVVTANHYWIDGIIACLVLAVVVYAGVLVALRGVPTELRSAFSRAAG